MTTIVALMIADDYGGDGCDDACDEVWSCDD